MSDDTATAGDPQGSGAGELSSPVSGLNSALGAGAGASLFLTARSKFVQRVRGRVRRELPAYLCVQFTWFMSFGLQMVLLPHLVTNEMHLGMDATALGLANLALSVPSVIFILLGGVVAERADGKKLLMCLHMLAALPAIALGYAVMNGNLTYSYIIVYGLALGTVGAFMMPARDAIVNEVVERRVRTGSGVTLQLGVTLATMAQFVAQIAWLAIAGYADKATTVPGWLGGARIGPIDSWRLLIVQGLVVAAGSIFAILLGRGRQIKTGRTGKSAALGDIAEGFRTVGADPRLWGMSVLMFGVGVFVIGSFLVVLPIINRDVYNLGADGIRDMFVTFWFGAFVSSVALSQFKYIKRQGRLLLIAQFIGSMAILIMLAKPPHYIFLGIVFLWGIAAGISIAISRSILQDAAPKEQLARALSIYQLGFMAGAPLGAAMMGFLTDLFPGEPQRVAYVPAIGMGVLIIWMARGTPVWNLKAKRPDDV